MNTKNMIQGLIRFRDEECGASAIEYGLFAALIAAVIAATVASLGTNINDKLVDVRDVIIGEADE